VGLPAPGREFRPAWENRDIAGRDSLSNRTGQIENDQDSRWIIAVVHAASNRNFQALGWSGEWKLENEKKLGAPDRSSGIAAG
jgi:hypothetical protein